MKFAYSYWENYFFLYPRLILPKSLDKFDGKIVFFKTNIIFRLIFKLIFKLQNSFLLLSRSHVISYF